jgi:hypothetical protein
MTRGKKDAQDDKEKKSAQDDKGKKNDKGKGIITIVLTI